VKHVALVFAVTVVALVVFLWRMPASAALWLLPHHEQTKNWVKLHELRGTLWSGGASATLIAIPATQTLTWSCSPHVFSLSISCELGSALTGQVTIRPLAQTFTASNIETAQAIQWSGIANSALSSELATIKISSALLSSNVLHVSANAVAKGVETRANNTVFSLGEVSIDCAPNNQASGSSCTLRNRASENRVDGSVELTSRRASGNLTFKPASASEQRFSF
jgi:hypothetical protein